MTFTRRMVAAGAALLPVIALPKTLYIRARTPLLDPGLFVGRRVALVGNGRSLLRDGNAPLIDAHDIVIRMNIGHPLIVRRDAGEAALPREWIGGVFADRRTTGADRIVLLKPSAPDDVIERFANARFVGRRTDIWSCSTADTARQAFFRERFACLHVACHPHLFHLALSFLGDPAFFRLPDESYRAVRQRLASRPSSGLIWIEYLRRQPIAALSLFGFDFFATGHHSRLSPLKSVAAGRWPHNGETERDECMAIMAADPRVRLH